ncbi:MAG: signal peptidase I [Thermoleophilaceae bacterium]
MRGKVLSTSLLAVALLLAALMILPPLVGYQRYVITGGSMAGSIDRGSLLFSKKVPQSELKAGDVITYRPPQGAGPGELVTHRIVSIKHAADGRLVFQTKGDANKVADPWTFTPDQRDQARAAVHVPYVGFVFAALGERSLRIALFAFPAILIALVMLSRVWRQAGEEVRSRGAQGVGA